jgi:DNA ligase (NAD+)
MKVTKHVYELLEEYKKSGLNYLQNISKEEVYNLYTITDDYYYNHETPLLTDELYDILKTHIYEISPDKIRVGASSTKNKSKLPFEMWSLNKIKTEEDLLKWTKKYPSNEIFIKNNNHIKSGYLIMDKLDGVSCLLHNNKLYTRGDGKIGQDISHLIPHIRTLRDKNTNELTIRGELIISKEIFQEKYASFCANPRNTISGIVNKTDNTIENINNIDFIAYEIIDDNLTPNEWKSKSPIDFVECIQIQSEDLNIQYLSHYLEKRRAESKYEIDGIVIMDNHIYSRKSENPKHAFAFKQLIADDTAEVVVQNVLWNASKDGYLKPRIEIEPIKLGGVMIKYATGFNAKYIETNKIGPGALIKITRSGGVIPDILEVIKPACIGQLPEDIEYEWSETHIDIILKDLNTPEVIIKTITRFFDDVVGLSEGNIRKIVDMGYDTIIKILKMSIDDLKLVEGFKDKMAIKIYDGLRNSMKKMTIIDLIYKSNIFGRGFSKKKIELIFQSYPNILKDEISEKEKIQKLMNIKGMAIKTSKTFVDKISSFNEFMSSIQSFISV